MEIVHKKNTSYYLVIPRVDSATPASFKSGETVVDTAYRRDGDGVWTVLTITDTFTEIGSTGVYALNLTAAEMNHDQILIKMTSTSGADSMVLFKMDTNDINDVADVVANIENPAPGNNTINN